MKVLLDECVDWRLSRAIVGHDVKTTRQMGWSGITNGALLTRAAPEFDVLITVDQNLSYQQHLAAFPIAVILLRARSNRRSVLLALIPELLATIPIARQGEATVVGTLSEDTDR